MTAPIVRVVLEDFAEGARMVGATLVGLVREVDELGTDPKRARQCMVAALAVPLATLMALALEVEAPWWAAISGFMSIMSTGAGSLRRGAMRLAGTIAGAFLGFVMARWLPYDHFALCLYLGAATMLGVVGMQVSPHGLSWLFFAITSCMVLLMGLENPETAVTVAYYRTFEVGVGVAAAIIIANLLEDWHADPPPPAPGWRHLLGAQWPALLHGFRAAITTVTVLLIWLAIDMPEVAQMAITVAAVMSAPVIGDGSIGTRHAVAQRSLHRLLGCLVGGVAALFCLSLGVTSFPWWLGMLSASVWVGMHIQNGRHGVGYAGTQAAFVFVVTLVQGAGPPESIMPGVDRFVGVAGGLTILLVVSLLLWPSDEEVAEEQASRRE